MKLTKKPKIENEARLSVSFSHNDLKKLLDGQITELSILRSDKEILIEQDRFKDLKITPMISHGGGWFLINYSECL